MKNRIRFPYAAIWLVLISAVSAWAEEPNEREVTFKGAGGTSLAGTLITPSGGPGSKFPALVLVAGSGPTDRNGNQPPALVSDLLKQIAGALAKHGVASLRFDKRGMHANRAELPADTRQYGDFFTWENFVDDVAAAHQFLREQPQIKPDRIGILGHSEGGTLALSVHKKLARQGTPAAVLVLVSTPGRATDVVITEQLTKLLKKQSATAEQSTFFLDQNARITKVIQETGAVPLDVPAGLGGLYPSYLGKFLRSEFAIDPCKLLAEFAGPVLVIEGEKDAQENIEQDVKLFEAALKSRNGDGHQIIVVPGASHNLKPVRNDADAGFAGDVSPEVLKQLGQWAAAKLQGELARK